MLLRILNFGEYFREAVSDKIELKILKTVAAGDQHCDTIYTLKE